jgi:hypothetical protein
MSESNAPQITIGELAELKKEALILLASFADPARRPALPMMAAALQPGPEDFDAIFLPPVAEAVRERYAGAFVEAPVPKPKRGQTIVHAAVLPAFLLGQENEISRMFPGAYGRLAAMLAPERVWACWKFLAPGSAAGMAYDGLVRLPDRWVWIPKPWRLIPPELVA